MPHKDVGATAIEFIAVLSRSQVETVGPEGLYFTQIAIVARKLRHVVTPLKNHEISSGARSLQQGINRAGIFCYLVRTWQATRRELPDIAQKLAQEGFIRHA